MTAQDDRAGQLCTDCEHGYPQAACHGNRDAIETALKENDAIRRCHKDYEKLRANQIDGLTARLQAAEKERDEAVRNAHTAYESLRAGKSADVERLTRERDDALGHLQNMLHIWRGDAVYPCSEDHALTTGLLELSKILQQKQGVQSLRDAACQVAHEGQMHRARADSAERRLREVEPLLTLLRPVLATLLEGHIACTAERCEYAALRDALSALGEGRKP